MATKSKTVENEKTADKIQRYIYLGPNHPNALIVNSTIYKGGIPKNISELLDKCPSAKALLVAIENTAKVLSDLRQENTAHSILYKKAKDELNSVKGV